MLNKPKITIWYGIWACKYKGTTSGYDRTPLRAYTNWVNNNN